MFLIQFRLIKSKVKILFVVDLKNKLLGSVASGDLRRSIRKKIDLLGQVDSILLTKETKPYDLDLLSLLRNIGGRPLILESKN